MLCPLPCTRSTEQPPLLSKWFYSLATSQSNEIGLSAKTKFNPDFTPQTSLGWDSASPFTADGAVCVQLGSTPRNKDLCANGIKDSETQPKTG